MSYLVFDARTGRQLWTAPAPGGVASFFAGTPVAYAGGVIVIGDASGELTGHNARTGAVAWTRSAPRSCPQSGEPEYRYDERLAGTGNLLVVSYQCETPGHGAVLVERLAPSSGVPLWRWRSPLAGMSVAGVATHGGVVLLAGEAGEDRYVPSLPRPRQWPTSLASIRH
jgi:outer membrane protein assembly factor BamB